MSWGTIALCLAGAAACNEKPQPSYRTYAARTASGAPLRWQQPTIVMQVARPLQKVSETMLLQALRSNIELWNEELAGCRVPRLVLGTMRESLPIKQDGISSVVVRTVEWCPDGASNDASCYRQTVEALTRVYPNEYGSPQEKGVIREADIEINAVYMKWSLDGSMPETHSLRAALAHELGHVLGLDDACNTPDALSAKGKAAALAPLCTSQDVRASIMYPDPNVSGRALVLKPGPSEVGFLCKSYEGRPPPGND
jgi:hypothetical protein